MSQNYPSTFENWFNKFQAILADILTTPLNGLCFGIKPLTATGKLPETVLFSSSNIFNLLKIAPEQISVMSSSLFKSLYFTNEWKDFIFNLWQKEINRNILMEDILNWKSLAQQNYQTILSAEDKKGYTEKPIPPATLNELYSEENNNFCSSSGCDFERNGIVFGSIETPEFWNKMITFNQYSDEEFLNQASQKFNFDKKIMFSEVHKDIKPFDFYFRNNNQKNNSTELAFARDYGKFINLEQKDLQLNFVFPKTTGILKEYSYTNPDYVSFNTFSRLKELNAKHWNQIYAWVDKIDRFNSEQQEIYFNKAKLFFGEVLFEKLLNKAQPVEFTNEELFILRKLTFLSTDEDTLSPVLQENFWTAELKVFNQPNFKLNPPLSINNNFQYNKTSCLLDILNDSKYLEHCIGDLSFNYFYQTLLTLTDKNKFLTNDKGILAGAAHPIDKDNITWASIYKNNKPYITLFQSPDWPSTFSPTGEIRGLNNSLLSRQNITKENNLQNYLSETDFKDIAKFTIRQKQKESSKKLLEEFYRSAPPLELFNGVKSTLELENHTDKDISD